MQELNLQDCLQLTHKNTAPFVLHLSDTTQVLCTQVLRLLPGKRLTVRAEFQNTTVALKCFFSAWRARMHFNREFKNYQQLKAAGLACPQLLYHSAADKVLIFTWLTANNPPLSTQNLSLLFVVVAQLHEHGFTMTDPHLDNFILAEDKLYLTDFGSLKQQRASLNLKQSIKNLGLLCARFLETPQLVTLLKEYFEKRQLDYSVETINQIIAKAKQEDEKLTQKYFKKIFRNSSQISFQKYQGTQLLCHRQYQKDLLPILKNIELINKLSNTYHIQSFENHSAAKTAWKKIHKQQEKTPVALLLTKTQASYMFILTNRSNLD